MSLQSLEGASQRSENVILVIGDQNTITIIARRFILTLIIFPSYSFYHVGTVNKEQKKIKKTTKQQHWLLSDVLTI